MNEQTTIQYTFIIFTILVFLSLYKQANAMQLYSNDGKFLGNVNNNQFDPNSVNNPFGRYGSPFSPDSTKNPFGKYGNPMSSENPNGRFNSIPPINRWTKPTY